MKAVARGPKKAALQAWPVKAERRLAQPAATLAQLVTAEARRQAQAVSTVVALGWLVQAVKAARLL